MQKGKEREASSGPLGSHPPDSGPSDSGPVDGSGMTGRCAGPNHSDPDITMVDVDGPAASRIPRFPLPTPQPAPRSIFEPDEFKELRRSRARTPSDGFSVPMDISQSSRGQDMAQPGPTSHPTNKGKADTPLQSPDQIVLGDLASGVTRTSATHFVVRPGLDNKSLRRWMEKLPENDHTDIMMAYLRYEHYRILVKMEGLEDRYDELIVAKLPMTKSWTERLHATSKAAVAAYLHMTAWTENQQWLFDTGIRDDTDWAWMNEHLIDAMNAMAVCVNRIEDHYRDLTEAAEEGNFEFLMPGNARLLEIRGSLKESGVRKDKDAEKRHRARVQSRARKLKAGNERSVELEIPSPLRQERGDSPVSMRGSSTHHEGLYSFETEPGIEIVDMSVVLQRFAALENNQA